MPDNPACTPFPPVVDGIGNQRYKLPGPQVEPGSAYWTTGPCAIPCVVRISELLPLTDNPKNEDCYFKPYPSDENTIKKEIKKLKDLAGFEKHPYLPRIKYEKALINLALVRWPTQRVGEYLQQAWKQAKYVREWNPKDTRWKANSLIIMSRVRRQEKECDKAIQYSTDALELIEKERNGGRNHILCEIDAYIARAEASILKARLDIEKENRVTLMGSQLLRETRKDLQQALRLNEKSEIPRTADTQDEKTFAVAWLNTSRSYVIGREKWHAELAFRRWKDVEAIVEHRGVHAFARKVRREIDSFGDFIIPEDEPDLDYRHHEANLRAHLIRTVQQRMPDQTQKEWAKELKITRQSFIKWSKPNQNKNNSG